jgi:hypothetical protein
MTTHGWFQAWITLYCGHRQTVERKVPMEVSGPKNPGPLPERLRPGYMHKQLCDIAAVEMDWRQRLVSSDDAMKRIGTILSGR